MALLRARWAILVLLLLALVLLSLSNIQTQTQLSPKRLVEFWERKGPAGGVTGHEFSNGIQGRKPGEVIMSQMANETLKAELGRSAWRLLHTMAGKFPMEPTTDEQETLRDFIYLFARLYPCGDCARHFKLVLQNHPPDVTSRKTISQWACDVHNVVNERLKKPLFDCTKVAEAWKCGCAEDDEATGVG